MTPRIRVARIRIADGVRVCRLAILAAFVFAAAAPMRAQDPQGTQTPSAQTPSPQTPSKEEQSEKPAKKEKRDKDKPVTLRGCLNGQTLEEIESEDPIDDLTPVIRLFSNGDLKKSIKASNKHHVEVTGILKLPPKSPLSKKFGKTTVSVGVGDPTRSPNQQQMMMPAIGTLDVKAFQSLAPSCEGTK